MSEPREITDTLNAIAAASNENRQLARERVAKWRAGSAIRLSYDFDNAPVELKQVVYDTTVRFSRRRWWSRLLR